MQNFSRYTDGWWSLRRVFGSEGFKADARRVADVPDDQFEAALTAVASATGLTDESEVQRLLGVIEDGQQRDAVFNFITTISAWKTSRFFDYTAGDFPQEIKRALVSALGDSEPPLPTTVAERVERISATSFPGIELSSKALQLITDVGAHLSRFTLVCDLRPIFDETRTRVEGLIPLTTLKLVTIGEDAAHPESFEVHLTESEVEDLAAKLDIARTKIASLKSFVKKSGVSLPDSPMLKKEGT